MARAWILVYAHRPGTSPARMNRLHNRLFGFKGRSNYGRYKYEQRGVLTGRSFLHLRRGVLVVPLDLGEAVRLLVEAEKARAWLRRVELEPEDERRLDGPSPSRTVAKPARKNRRKRR